MSSLADAIRVLAALILSAAALLLFPAGAVLAGAALSYVAPTGYQAETAPAFWRRSDTVSSARLALIEVAPPPGFRLEVFALTPGARDLVVSASGRAVFVRGSENGLAVLIDANRDERVEAALRLASMTVFDAPLSPCVAPDGGLYAVGGAGRYFFPAAEFVLTDPMMRVYRLGGAQRDDGAASVGCAFTYDGALHVADDDRAGEVRRMTARGGDPHVIAALPAPARAIALRPADGALWVNTGEALGPLARMTPPDADDPEAAALIGPPPADARMLELAPVATAQEGGALQGFAFVTGEMFPADQRGALVYVERDAAGAARVMLLRDVDQADATPEVLIEGWPEGGGPAGIAFLRDGSMLLADPAQGAIYRLAEAPVTIVGPEEEADPAEQDEPAQDMPADDAPADDAPAQDAPANDAPAQDMPTDAGPQNAPFVPDAFPDAFPDDFPGGLITPDA